MRTWMLLAVALLTAPGCGTLLGPGPDMVKIDSNPQGADVLIDGAIVGRTPLTAEVKRAAVGHDIEVKLDGYEPYSARMVNEQNPWAGGGVVLGLLTWVWWPMVGVDLLTGNMRRTPDQPTVNLAAIAPRPPAAAAPGAAE